MSLPSLPPGLRCLPEFIGRDEELHLLKELEALDWDGRGQIRRMGNIVKRREIDFIHDYGRHNRRVTPGAPLPPFLEPLRQHCAAVCGIDRNLFQQVIAAKYPTGAAIDWHVDSVKAFGEPICSLSLASTCTMQFRLAETKSALSSLELPPRTLLVFTGPARWDCQHHIRPVTHTRYSVTLRVLRSERQAPPA